MKYQGRRHLSGRTLTVALAVTALVLAGCSDSKDEPEGDGSDDPTTAEGSESEESDDAAESFEEVEDFYEQTIEWTDCDSYECGKLVVPVDYDDPSGETIELNLSRVAAEGGEPIGSLIVNPGGPGAAGSDMVETPAGFTETFGAPLRESFDIVGFDPRGTGESAPVDCFSDSDLDAYLAADPTPDDPGEVDEMAERQKAFWEGCLDKTGELLAHVSTVESATDIDVLRAALGDDKLNYLGFSYGTRLGATYAELFPETVGRMVLDAAVDPALDSYEGSLSQAKGFERALRAYVENCLAGGDCFLGDNLDAALTTISDLIEQVDDEPLPTSLGADLLVGNLYSGIAVTLYNREYWTYLDTGLQQALAGDGSTLLSLAYAYARREGGSYATNIMESFPVISCLDDPASIPLEEIPDHLAEFEEVAPTMGDNWAWGLDWCGDIPVEKTVEDLTIRAEGAAPIIVIGTTRDPATPYEEAVAMAEELESGVLVGRDGDGHGGYRKGSDCVDDAVHALLLDGEAPDGDVDC